MAFVSEARRILSYYKHLSEEQRPPKSIWHSIKKCEEWIESHNPYDTDKKPKGLFVEDWEHE